MKDHECQPRTVYVREQTEKGRRWKPIGTACPTCFASVPKPAEREVRTYFKKG